jgi:hypothetical protein
MPENDESIAEMKERIKDIDVKNRLIIHNNETETSTISNIVLQLQKILFILSNKTLGPFIEKIRTILPHLLYKDDQLANSVLLKYQKMAERNSSVAVLPNANVLMVQQSPGGRLKKNHTLVNHPNKSTTRGSASFDEITSVIFEPVLA